MEKVQYNFFGYICEHDFGILFRVFSVLCFCRVAQNSQAIHLHSTIILVVYIPYSGKIWRPNNLAIWPMKAVGGKNWQFCCMRAHGSSVGHGV